MTSKLKVSKRDPVESRKSLAQKLKHEKEAGNPIAEQIRQERPPRAKNLTVGVTQPELEFLSAQQTKTLSSPEYRASNHNGRTSTSDGNEASNIIRMMMDMSKLMKDKDYRKWLPEMVEKHLAEKGEDKE